MGSRGKERRREEDPAVVRSRDRYPGKRTPRLRAAPPGDPAGLRRAVDLHDPPSDSHPECLGRAGGKGSAGREHALERRGVVHLGECREVGGHAHEVGGCVSAQACNDRLRMEGRLADDDTAGPERQEDTEEETVDVVWRGSRQDSSATRHAEDASEHGRLAQELNAGLGATLAAPGASRGQQGDQVPARVDLGPGRRRGGTGQKGADVGPFGISGAIVKEDPDIGVLPKRPERVRLPVLRQVDGAAGLPGAEQGRREEVPVGAMERNGAGLEIHELRGDPARVRHQVGRGEGSAGSDGDGIARGVLENSLHDETASLPKSLASNRFERAW